MTKSKTEAASAVSYTKAQLIASRRYAARRDILGALLEDGKRYTVDQADELIEKYMKGKVK